MFYICVQIWSVIGAFLIVGTFLKIAAKSIFIWFLLKHKERKIPSQNNSRIIFIRRRLKRSVFQFIAKAFRFYIKLILTVI